jgi:hypothetical protein
MFKSFRSGASAMAARWDYRLLPGGETRPLDEHLVPIAPGALRAASGHSSNLLYGESART